MVFLIPHSFPAPMRLLNRLAERRLARQEYTHAGLRTSAPAALSRVLHLCLRQAAACGTLTLKERVCTQMTEHTRRWMQHSSTSDIDILVEKEGLRNPYRRREILDHREILSVA
jgi:hypothetical protein